MTNSKKNFDATMNAAFLTGLILGQVKYNERITGSDKVFLLNKLIATHTDNPIISSDALIEECKDLLYKLEVSV